MRAVSSHSLWRAAEVRANRKRGREAKWLCRWLNKENKTILEKRQILGQYIRKKCIYTFRIHQRWQFTDTLQELLCAIYGMLTMSIRHNTCENSDAFIHCYCSVICVFASFTWLCRCDVEPRVHTESLCEKQWTSRSQFNSEVSYCSCPKLKLAMHLVLGGKHKEIKVQGL